MSRLERESVKYREELLAKSRYRPEDEYAQGHPDALSDGDNRGRGETTSIGTAIDIQTRNKLLAKSKYNKNNEYNLSNA